MMNLLRDISLRAKITASFVLIVLGGTFISTSIGSFIITNAMRREALKQARRGLEAASTVYAARLDALRKVTVSAAHDRGATAAVGDSTSVRQFLTGITKANDLDFAGMVDLRSKRVTRASDSLSALPAALSGALRPALEGNETASTEVFDWNTLAGENPSLARFAGSTSDSEGHHAGLVLFAAAPVRVGHSVTGAVYGGVLLNGNHQIIDQMGRLIYGGDQAAGGDVGRVSIYLGDSRIAPSASEKSEARVAGTRVSQDVSRTVLAERGQWYGRVLESNGWHMAAFQPIRSGAGRIVGILHVGLPEAPFLAVRTDMMLSFLFVAAVGVVVVLGLTYLITRSMIYPLEEMVVASNRIAAGDLDRGVNVRSHDEIGLLAGSFNKMITSIKTMKHELEEWGRTLEEKVNARTEELVAVQTQMAQSEKLASIGRLAAGVAHEINNPLGGILSFSMLALEDCPRDHPMRENLDIIVKQTLRCRETVKGLLDFARQSSTALTVVDANSIVDKTIALLENQSIFHDIRIERRLQPRLPSVLIDAGQLQQVVVNIVINAVDAMEESGVLTVETLAVRQTNEVLVRISDTGKGIPDEVLPFIFEPFFTTKKVGKGTGLGLSIVHGIVTRAGGKIDVVTSSRGTTFTARLPVAQEERSAVESTSQPGPGAGPRKSAGRG